MRSLLVAEDVSGASIQRIVSRYKHIRVASSRPEALALLDAHRDWCGFVIDVNLADTEIPRAAGIEVLGVVRDRFPQVPAILVSETMTREVVNRAAMLGSSIIGKPFGESELSPFLQRVVAGQHGLTDEFSERLGQVSRSWKLSPREHEILVWHLVGGSRLTYLKRSGVAESTFKTHVKRMLTKSGASSLAEMTQLAFRNLMKSSLPPRYDGV